MHIFFPPALSSPLSSQRKVQNYSISVSVGLGPCSIRDSQAQGQQRARWVIHRPASMAPQRYIISANGHTPPPVHTPKHGGQPSQAAHAVDNHLWCTRRGRTSSVSSSSVMRHACWHGRRLGPQEHGSTGAESGRDAAGAGIHSSATSFRLASVSPSM